MIATRFVSVSYPLLTSCFFFATGVPKATSISDLSDNLLAISGLEYSYNSDYSHLKWNESFSPSIVLSSGFTDFSTLGVLAFFGVRDFYFSSLSYLCSGISPCTSSCFKEALFDEDCWEILEIGSD